MDIFKIFHYEIELLCVCKQQQTDCYILSVCLSGSFWCLWQKMAIFAKFSNGNISDSICAIEIKFWHNRPEAVLRSGLSLHRCCQLTSCCLHYLVSTDIAVHSWDKHTSNLTSMCCQVDYHGGLVGIEYFTFISAERDAVSRVGHLAHADHVSATGIIFNVSK